MKKHIFISYFILLNLISFGQNIKYDDIIELVVQKNYQKAYSLLFDYQQSDPEFANTYFQLANISYYWAINSDPRINIKQTEYYIHNTKLFYSLVKSKLNVQNNDARKNDDFYKTVPELNNTKKLDNQTVIAYIDKKTQKLDEIDLNIHQFANYFNLFVKSYNKTKELFNEIISENKNLNDIYLQPKAATISKTNKIILQYDSSLYYFQLYKNSISNYSYKKYNQILIQNNINIYRLEGLQSTNFLLDTIYIWDYKKWATTVQNKLNSDITHFRETISKTNIEINKKEAELLNDPNYSNSFKNYILDQKTIFEIEKYDYNSIITSLFKYRSARIDFLVQNKKLQTDTSNYTYSPISRAIEYYQLTLKKQITDSLLIELQNKITYDNYLKHKDFFDFNYNNFDGIKNFITTQQFSNDKILTEALNNLKYFIFRDVFFQTNKTPTTEYQSKKINLFADNTDPTKAVANNYYTLAIANYSDKKYITGYYKTNYGTNPFIAKIVNGQIEWLKNITIGTRIINFGAIITANSNGCIFVIHSINGNKHSNTLLQFSSNGQQISKQQLNNTNLPRFLNFDEINSQILLAFHGTKFNYFNETSDTLKIIRLNSNSNNIDINQEIILQGNLTNIIRIDSTYHIFANFTKISIRQQNLFNTKGNTAHLTFSTNGDFINATELKPKHYFWAIHAFKINNKTINIIGFSEKDDIKNNSFINLPALYYLTIKTNGKITYQNFN